MRGHPRAATRPPGTALALLALVAGLIAGCSSQGQDPSAAGAPPCPPGAASCQPAPSLPKYYDARALLDAVGTRVRSDSGALITLDGTLDPQGSGGAPDGAPAPPGRRDVSGTGALRYDDGQVAVRFDQRLGDPGGGTAGGAPRTTGGIRTDGRTWLRPPAAAGWVEVGRADVAPADRVDAALAANIAATADPLAGVNRYPDAVLVADASDERVGDTATVRYTLVVDLGRAAATETDPARRSQLTAQANAGLTRISSEVWVDADQRPVRTRIRQDVPGGGALDLVTDYREWGTPVTVDPPPTG